MRSKIVVISTVVLASVLARHNHASASVCSTTDSDTDTADQQMFVCEGNANPLPDPITGLMDPRPSIFFAQYGRPAVPPPIGCNTKGTIPAIPAPSCGIITCPDPNAISGTGNTQWSFYIQDNDRFHLDNNEWSNNGKSDTIFYDQNQPYSKILNTAFLLWFGLKDNTDLMFHGTQDYVDLMRANDSVYHSTFFRSVTTPTDYNGSFDPNFIGDDEIEGTCNIYSNTNHGINSVVYRVGVQMHEAWHAWENLNVSEGGLDHKNGPDGDCKQNVTEFCDPFYTHALDTFRPFGTLHNGGKPDDCGLPPRFCAGDVGVPGFHSPNQIAFEWGCDFVNSHADWVTNDILGDVQAAQDDFNARFINTPPFQCGTSDPMMSPI